uniref:Uncharacterized protein n=1 Tax=Rhizophora mucronata TaxID=61149 RepID=A0A2P2JZQ3_RHIMU
MVLCVYRFSMFNIKQQHQTLIKVGEKPTEMLLCEMFWHIQFMLHRNLFETWAISIDEPQSHYLLIGI